MLPDDLVARIRTGDISAFETLFRATHPPLVAFVTRIVGARAIADDVVQELFADIWIDRARLEVRTTVRAYLFGAARNRALNVVRRRAVEIAVEHRDEHDDVSGLHASPPRQPDAPLDEKELQQRLSVAIASLPERARLVMELRWGAGLSHAEVAEAMGISIKGVENQLARSLKRLREDFR